MNNGSSKKVDLPKLDIAPEHLEQVQAGRQALKLELHHTLEEAKKGPIETVINKIKEQRRLVQRVLLAARELMPEAQGVDILTIQGLVDYFQELEKLLQPDAAGKVSLQRVDQETILPEDLAPYRDLELQSGKSLEAELARLAGLAGPFDQLREQLKNMETAVADNTASQRLAASEKALSDISQKIGGLSYGEVLANPPMIMKDLARFGKVIIYVMELQKIPLAADLLNLLGEIIAFFEQKSIKAEEAKLGTLGEEPKAGEGKKVLPESKLDPELEKLLKIENVPSLAHDFSFQFIPAVMLYLDLGRKVTFQKYILEIVFPVKKSGRARNLTYGATNTQALSDDEKKAIVAQIRIFLAEQQGE